MSSAAVRICGAIRPQWKVIFAWVGLALMVALRWETLQQGIVTDWSEVSGWILLIIGFSLARGLESNFERLIQRMRARGVLEMSGEDQSSLLEKIRRRAAIAELTGMILPPLLLGFAYTIHYWARETGDGFVLKMILELTAISLAGGIAGRIVAYGFLGKWLSRHDCRVKVTIGHPDGAGGLRVVGSFYLFQAGLAMLPVIFFAFWFVVGPVWSESGFKDWQLTYGLAFLGTLVVEIAAFVLPMVFFHREMQRGSEHYFREADDLGNEVMKLKSSLMQSTDPEEIASIQVRIEAHTQKIQSLENAPTWPVDAGIRQRFAWGNVLLFLLPFVVKSESISGFIENSIQHFLP